MGMPSEGLLANATIKRLIRDVPLCKLEDDAAVVKSGIADDWNVCAVVDSHRTVLGLLELERIPTTKVPIEDIMKPAPLTLRPSMLIDEAIAYFNDSDLTFALVTKLTGELMGAIRKSDLENTQSSFSDSRTVGNDRWR
jgi:Mg/Co/Ni transporter MgtE